MRKVALGAFRKKMKSEFIWKKDSRVAVLLEHSGHWWKFSESFRHELAVACDVFYLEMDLEESDWQKQMEDVRQWKPDGIVGIGGFEVLQRACWLRNTLLKEKLSLLLFSGSDHWKMLEKESLWVRNQEGETIYWGHQREDKEDLLVLPDKVLHKKKTEIGLEVLGSTVAIWKSRIDYLLAEEKDLEWNEKKRTILEELAEPMRIRYGIPMAIGLYYGILYLYRILSEEQKQKLCIRCKVSFTEGCWHLEKIAHQACAKELAAAILPRKDVFLLTQMAMEGIENLPIEQQLSWQKVENFYRELC